MDSVGCACPRAARRSVGAGGRNMRDWKCIMSEKPTHTLIPTGEATAILPVAGGREKPITVIGTHAIRQTFSEATLLKNLNHGQIMTYDARIQRGSFCTANCSSHWSSHALLKRSRRRPPTRTWRSPPVLTAS